MKISVKNGKKGFTIVLPNLLLFSTFSSWIFKKASKDGRDQLNISPSAMREIRRCIRKMRKIHKNWCLVDVYDPNDASVKIKL